MYGKLRSLAFTSLGHFSNDGTTLLYPTLITYYVELPGIKIPYLGAMAIIFNIISGIFSTPVGNYADRRGNHGTLIAVGILILALSRQYQGKSVSLYDKGQCQKERGKSENQYPNCYERAMVPSPVGIVSHWRAKYP